MTSILSGRKAFPLFAELLGESTSTSIFDQLLRMHIKVAAAKGVTKSSVIRQEQEFIL